MGDQDGKETSVVQKANGSMSNSQGIPGGQLENGSVRQALENEDVLERIFLWTAFEDLRNCRLVSQLWNRASTKQLESKSAPITIPENVDNLKKLVSVLDSSWNFPCTKFKLDGASVTYIRPREERLLNKWTMERQLCKFFESAGAKLKQLSIFEWHLWTDQHFQKNLPQNVEYSCLKVLNVQIGAVVWSSPKEHLNNFKILTSLLENAPKLERFSLYRTSYYYKYAEITPILNALESVSQRSLRYLQIDGGLTDEHLIRLTSMGLKLKGFKCMLQGRKAGPGGRDKVARVWNLEHSLKGFLESLKDTLEEFELSFDGFSQPESFSLPQMPKLAKLKVTKPWWLDERPANLSLGKIVYQEQLPVLKCLEFSNMDEAFIMENFVQPQPKLATVDTVEELVFGYQLENSTVVLKASRLFTKLRKLEVYWDIRVVNAVFELVDGLEELTLVSKYGYSILQEPISVSIDQLLTGCSEKELQDMRNWSSEKLEGFVKEPPAFLQSLKVLRLKSSSSFPERSTLTDIGCELVLMRLKSFEKLEVGWQMPPEVSENMLERMKQKFRVCLGSRPQPGRHIVQY